MKNFILILTIFLFLFTNIESSDISATGGWTELINASDLISGAGSNLNSIYTSVTNASIITITNVIGNAKWRVNVKRTDTLWNASFILNTRRTSSGTGTGTINGGLTYIAITPVDRQFFTGRRNRSNISIQYQLSGMSISIPPNNYTTTVTFTIVDI